jgi:hypothetical protein
MYLETMQYFKSEIIFVMIASLSSDFVHKTFQVPSLSHLQNGHVQARWGVINAHALA